MCAVRCRHASGVLATQRAQPLQRLLLPNRSVGYDVLVHVGLERFLHHRQREEIRDTLQTEHGLTVSTGSISDLGRLAREIGQKLGGDIAQVRDVVQAWQQEEDGEHALSEGKQGGLGVVRALAQWVLDYPVASTGADFPFVRLEHLERRGRSVPG